MEMVMKNKIRDFGVFMALLIFPISLIMLGVMSAIQRVMDFMSGFIPLFPIDIINGGGLVFSLAGCVVLIAMGAFFFWAALPVYKEHINNG
jgi:hypothetical protein